MSQNKKRLKLKKWVYYVIFVIILIIVIVIGVNLYKEYKYRQSNEYKLLQLGYTDNEVDILLEKLSNNTVKDLLTKDKDDDVVSFAKEKYYIDKNLNEYLAYYDENKNTSTKDVVAIINVNADHDWYDEELETDTSKNELMIVNKFYALTKDYAPENLVTIPLDYSYGNEGDNKLIDYAYEHFLDLWNAAYDEGHHLMVKSSYRDYESQEEVYNYRKETYGQRAADETAARPGHSEHQTGLVVDMTSTTEASANEFKNSDAYKWLKENAYKYGFIERYPEDKEYLTGYSAESWHWRYVGVDAATTMHKNDITYDEYYAFYIENQGK